MRFDLCSPVLESGVLPRQKRRYAGHSASYKSSLPVYNRLIEVLNNLALLLENNPLTDTTVLKVAQEYEIAVPSLFLFLALYSRHPPVLCGEC